MFYVMYSGRPTALTRAQLAAFRPLWQPSVDSNASGKSEAVAARQTASRNRRPHAADAPRSRALSGMRGIPPGRCRRNPEQAQSATGREQQTVSTERRCERPVKFSSLFSFENAVCALTDFGRR